MSSASSPRAGQRPKNAAATKKAQTLSPELAAELAQLEALGDAQIDVSDIPVQAHPHGPVYVGLFYQGKGKKSVTIRLDTDVVEWFKAQGKGWQTKMNWALRLYYASHRNKGAKIGAP